MALTDTLIPVQAQADIASAGWGSLSLVVDVLSPWTLLKCVVVLCYRNTKLDNKQPLGEHNLATRN